MNGSFGAQQTQLRAHLFDLLGTLLPPLRDDVEMALRAPGKLLSSLSSEEGQRPAGSWSLLTLLVAQSVDADVDCHLACRVAVAVECLICALDLLDDVEDGDRSPVLEILGNRRTLNVSTTLLFLAHTALLSCHQQQDTRTLQLLEVYTNALLQAASGQHRDLIADGRGGMGPSEEECLEIATMKAGSLMSLACHLGALCAGASDAVCQLFTEMGTMLGIAHQLDNDAHDAHHFESTEYKKSDVERQQTLPFALAAQQTTPQVLASAADRNKKEWTELYRGMLETWGLGLLYRERARQYARTLAVQRMMTPSLLLLLGLGEQEECS